MERVAVAIAFAGRIKSGKSTVARRLAETLSLPYAAFGEAVRQEARARGLDDSDRTVLQELGQKLIDSELVYFCNKVLVDARWTAGMGIVIDGVRHLVALDELRRRLAPVMLQLVFIDVTDEIQATRFLMSDSSNRLEKIESHATEHDVLGILREKADKTINTQVSLDTTVRALIEWIGECQQNS